MLKKPLSMKLSALAFALMLAGCGGGGSDGYFNSQQPSSPTNPSTGETVESANIGAIELKNIQGESTQVISSNGVIASVKVTDQSGAGIAGALVTFTGTGGIIFGNSNGAVLTNSDGIASISVQPESAESSGAYKLSASVEYDGKTLIAKDKLFSLEAVQVELKSFQVENNLIQPGTATNVSLKTSNKDFGFQNNVTVNFSASCGTFEPAFVVSANQGDVLTSYKAVTENGELCEGQQTITASAQGTGSISKTVNIATIQADSLVYSTSAPVDLGIKSSGSAASGQIEFTLYANGSLAKNKEVLVELKDAPPDLSFVSLNNRQNQVIKSDANGKVLVNVYPGNLPGPVEIKASLVSAPNVSASSKDVKVSIGRATQNAFSISVSKQALRADIDGDASIITARLADRTGNPVPKGTVVSFISEGGKVDPNCATDDRGECSVSFTTQNPRPVNDRVTVLAYVEGDKAFTDVDKDNIYTPGVDILTDNVGDFFRDDNENNTFDVGEFIYEKAAGVLDCANSTISQPNVPKTCNNSLNTVLRKQILFAFSHDTPTYVWQSGVSNAVINSGSGSFSFQIYGNTQRTVPMPSGTEVTVEVKDNTDNSLDCEAEIRSGHLPVPGTFNMLTPTTFAQSSNTVTQYGVNLRNCAAGDDVRLVTAVPDGKTVTTWLGIKPKA